MPFQRNFGKNEINSKQFNTVKKAIESGEVVRNTTHSEYGKVRAIRQVPRE